MKEFKVGDAVRIRGNSRSGEEIHGRKFFLNRPWVSPDWWEVVDNKTHCKESYIVNIGQCRRLIKKPRRRIWVDCESLPYDDVIVRAQIPSEKELKDFPKRWIEFIEVKRKSAATVEDKGTKARALLEKIKEVE